MPLYVNGKLINCLPSSITSFFDNHPVLKESAIALKLQPSREIGPVGLIYVCQREFAVTIAADNYMSTLGTEDATTCHILVLRHTGSGAISLAHLDGSDMQTAISAMLIKIFKLSSHITNGRLEVHLIGGFIDSRGISAKLSKKILDILIRLPDELHLMTACISDLNDAIKNGIHWPVIYGIGIDIKTGIIFPAHFLAHGPDRSLRGARCFTGDYKVLDIYDLENGWIKIGPFSYEYLYEVETWLLESDDYLRQHLSTSPEVEPPHFVSHVRESLQQIQNHPHPELTVFIGGKPRIFQQDVAGNWIRVEA